ncbi:MAG: cytochrome c maturation protein CcmE [Rhodobacteraceae bacterium]|nr:cytochrome c maturation protein CcmE [Paracoccaceae bacterium]
MAGLKKKRRIQMIVVGMVLLAASSALIGYAMKDGIEFFRSPTQIAENRPGPNERFRVGGLVEVDSLVRGEGKAITFVVTDGNEMINVSFTGILPDLFGEGQGVVATGKLLGDTFVATEILAKHDENYMPKEVIDALKEQGIYEEPAES